MNLKPLILIGGGGHCRSCIDVIEASGLYSIKGIIDVESNLGARVLGYDIIGVNEDIPKLVGENVDFLITIGNVGRPTKRIELYSFVKALGGVLPTIISPTAIVSKYAYVGAGTIVMHHAVVNVSASVGENCIINTKALIEHDTIIGDHCHISTGAIINGACVIGAESFLGSGAVTKQCTIVPEASFIKANSIVK